MQDGSANRWRAVRDPRWPVFAVVATVGVFAFVVSYSHIYDLGRAHAQNGTAARLLPLSVDGLIVAATMVMFIQARHGRPPDWRGRWMPRLTLYAAIAATVAANVAYGLPSGWLSAVLSGWPGAAFVAAVELGIIVVRLVPQPAPVPASAGASVKRKLPPLREIQERQGCGQETARKIRAELAAFERSRGGTTIPAPVPAAQAAPAGNPPIPAGALNGHARGR